MWDYSERLKNHFFHPRNVGEVGDSDGVGEVGSLACGDALKLTFKLDKNKRIKEPGHTLTILNTKYQKYQKKGRI